MTDLLFCISRTLSQYMNTCKLLRKAFEYLRQDTSGSSQREPQKRGTWLNLMSLSLFFFIAKNYIGSHSYHPVQTAWPQYSPSEVGVKDWIIHSKNVIHCWMWLLTRLKESSVNKNAHTNSRSKNKTDHGNLLIIDWGLVRIIC